MVNDTVSTPFTKSFCHGQKPAIPIQENQQIHVWNDFKLEWSSIINTRWAWVDTIRPMQNCQNRSWHRSARNFPEAIHNPIARVNFRFALNGFKLDCVLSIRIMRFKQVMFFLSFLPIIFCRRLFAVRILEIHTPLLML